MLTENTFTANVVLLVAFGIDRRTVIVERNRIVLTQLTRIIGRFQFGQSFVFVFAHIPSPVAVRCSRSMSGQYSENSIAQIRRNGVLPLHRTRGQLLWQS